MSSVFPPELAASYAQHCHASLYSFTLYLHFLKPRGHSFIALHIQKVCINDYIMSMSPSARCSLLSTSYLLCIHVNICSCHSFLQWSVANIPRFAYPFCDWHVSLSPVTSQCTPSCVSWWTRIRVCLAYGAQ